MPTDLTKTTKKTLYTVNDFVMTLTDGILGDGIVWPAILIFLALEKLKAIPTDLASWPELAIFILCVLLWFVVVVPLICAIIKLIYVKKGFDEPEKYEDLEAFRQRLAAEENSKNKHTSLSRQQISLSASFSALDYHGKSISNQWLARLLILALVCFFVGLTIGMITTNPWLFPATSLAYVIGGGLCQAFSLAGQFLLLARNTYQWWVDVVQNTGKDVGKFIKENSDKNLSGQSILLYRIGTFFLHCLTSPFTYKGLTLVFFIVAICVVRLPDNFGMPIMTISNIDKAIVYFAIAGCAMIRGWVWSGINFFYNRLWDIYKKNPENKAEYFPLFEGIQKLFGVFVKWFDRDPLVNIQASGHCFGAVNSGTPGKEKEPLLSNKKTNGSSGGVELGAGLEGREAEEEKPTMI